MARFIATSYVKNLDPHHAGQYKRAEARHLFHKDFFEWQNKHAAIREALIRHCGADPASPLYFYFTFC
jgi:hypothetical protein